MPGASLPRAGDLGPRPRGVRRAAPPPHLAPGRIDDTPARRVRPHRPHELECDRHARNRTKIRRDRRESSAAGGSTSSTVRSARRSCRSAPRARCSGGIRSAPTRSVSPLFLPPDRFFVSSAQWGAKGSPDPGGERGRRVPARAGVDLPADAQPLQQLGGGRPLPLRLRQRNPALPGHGDRRAALGRAWLRQGSARSVRRPAVRPRRSGDPRPRAGDAGRVPGARTRAGDARAILDLPHPGVERWSSQPDSRR